MEHIKGAINETKHHKIAAKLKTMSDEWDRIEEETSVRPPEAYDYSIGLIMSRELTFAALPENLEDLKQKIDAQIVALDEVE